MNTLLRFLMPSAFFLSACYAEPAVRVHIRPNPPPLGVDEVTRLMDAGISDSVIVDEIKTRGMSARPTSDQIVALKKEGLSDAVLQTMNEAPLRSDHDVIVESLGSPYPYYYSYYPYYYPYPYYYGPWWYGGPYWGFYYHYPYYYPYGHTHVYAGSVHRYR
jgi:hypothetical protein